MSATGERMLGRNASGFAVETTTTGRDDWNRSGGPARKGQQIAGQS